MPLRLLVRAAPFVLGAVAAAIWLRRRAAKRRGLPRPAARPALTPAAKVPAPAAAARPRTGRFDRPPTGRFVRAESAPREHVDIVTVVDDLLLAGAR